MTPGSRLTRRLFFPAALVAIAALGLFIRPAPSAHAGSNIVVDTLADTGSVGKCSLRDAIIAANTASVVFGCNGTAAAVHTITFGVAGTIVVTGSLPFVVTPLTIDGGNKIVLDGGGSQSIFGTNPGGSPFNLYNITLRNAYSSSYHGAALYNNSGITVNISNTQFLTNSVLGYSGGAIINYGTMNIYGSTFSGNKASAVPGFGGNGGAIINSSYGGGGVLVIANTTFSSNTSNVAGGAIENGAALTVTKSAFTQNQSGTSGGALDSGFLSRLAVAGSSFTSNSAISTSNSFGGAIEIGNANSLVILDSTFSNNYTAKNSGGALHAFNIPAISIGTSTFSNNSAGNGNDYGGAIYVYGSTIAITSSAILGNQAFAGGGIGTSFNTTMTITNTTFSGNSAKTDGGGINVDNTPFTLTLNNSTIANNLAGNGGGYGDGGGIKVIGTVRLRNSIIAKNIDLAGTAKNDCAGTLISQGNNLLGDNTGCTGLTNAVNNDKVGTSGSPLDPLLGPLSNLGGPTLVLPLRPGSPAADAGNNATCASTDQRGVARPIGANCDMGAFEGLAYWLYLPLILR